LRRGGSAHVLARWHFLLAETGLLKQNPDGKFTPPPPSASWQMGTPPESGGEVFRSLIENIAS